MRRSQKHAGARPSRRLSSDTVTPDPVLHRRYRAIVGALGWLNQGTRPDISHAYSELSKFVQCPGQKHMDAALDACSQRWLWRYPVTRALSSALPLLLLPPAVWPTPLVFGKRCVRCSSTLSVLSCPLSAPQTSSDQSGHPTFCCHRKFPVPFPPRCSSLIEGLSSM